MVWTRGVIQGKQVVTAPALLALFDEINERYPDRTRGNGDGTIGDTSHIAQGSASDHNPQLLDDGRWYVMALDVQHSVGFDSWAFADFLADRMAKGIEQRIQYIVSNRRICNWDPYYGAPRGIWRPYTGSDPHTGHIHISLRHQAALANDTGPWIPDVSTADEPIQGDDDTMRIVRPAGYYDTYVLGAGEPKHVRLPSDVQFLVDEGVITGVEPGTPYFKATKPWPVTLLEDLAGFDPAKGTSEG